MDEIVDRLLADARYCEACAEIACREGQPDTGEIMRRKAHSYRQAAAILRAHADTTAPGHAGESGHGRVLPAA